MVARAKLDPFLYFFINVIIAMVVSCWLNRHQYYTCINYNIHIYQEKSWQTTFLYVKHSVWVATRVYMHNMCTSCAYIVDRYVPSTLVSVFHKEDTGGAISISTFW